MSAMPSIAAKSAGELRRRRGRRGFCRHVHAAPVARAGNDGAGLRAGLGCRRHLVLEPISRRALRRREHAVFLFVLRRAAAGMGLERAIRAAAGDIEIRQPCRRPLQSAPRHPVQYPRRERRRSTRRHRVVGHDFRRQDGRPQNSSCSPPAACRMRGCPTSRASIVSRARSITPATGRMKRSILPASASASSARDRRRSSRCRSLPNRRANSRYFSAPRISPFPPATRRSREAGAAEVSRADYPEIRRFAREVARTASIPRCPTAARSTTATTNAARNMRRAGTAAGSPSCRSTTTSRSTRRPTTPPPISSARRSPRS